MSVLIPTALLTTVARSSRPHLTFYSGSDGSDRIELSGRVLANWVTKTGNYIAEEGVTRGQVVRIALPVHWRAVVWAWGTWVQGVAVCTRGTSAATAVLVTHEPEAVRGVGPDVLVVAVPLGPLDLVWDGELPAGAVDGGAAVMTQPDVVTAAAPWVEGAVAVAGPGLTFADLGAAIGVGTAERIAFAPRSVWDLVRRSIAAWSGGGSVVVLGPDVPRARWAAIAAQEGARLEA